MTDVSQDRGGMEMVRIIKSQEERRKEIMDAATRLFKEKGYEQTIVSDIVSSVNVSQGTFYNYFKSKDDILVAILEELREDIVKELVKEEMREDLNALQKLNSVTQLEFLLNRQQDSLFSLLHLEENVGIHQRYITSTINRLIPIYTTIIEQGIREGVFTSKYPVETAEYLLVATKFMFDPNINPKNLKEVDRKNKAVQDIGERILGLEEGSLVNPNKNISIND